MAIFRKAKKNDYTVIDNNVFKNQKLSLKAKGMICTMLSLPDDWNFSEEGLASLSNDSRSGIRSTIQELMEYGYLTRKQLKDSNGKFINSEYTIYEEPLYEKPTTEKPLSGKPTSENVHNKILNNKILNNKILNNKEIYKEKRNEEFEKVWEMYPNKKGKANALKSFEKAIKEGVTVEDITNGLQNYIAYIEAERIEPRYVKNGSTWFNQKCWEDDYTIKRKPTTKDLASVMDFTDFINEGRKKRE